MSSFGELFTEVASPILGDWFEDNYTYQPMAEIPNASPVPDTTRTGGTVRIVLSRPGVELGVRGGLATMHPRSSANLNMRYRAIGLLTDVRQFDRFTLQSAVDTDPAELLRVEVLDGPEPIGFGWYKAKMVQLPLTD